MFSAMKVLDNAAVDPGQYVRLPQPGRRFVGMCRTTLQNLADDGCIDIVTIQRPGATRGIKLIYLPSLWAYLNGLRRTQSPQKETLVVPLTD
jgi:hypothetical protein